MNIAEYCYDLTATTSAASAVHIYLPLLVSCLYEIATTQIFHFRCCKDSRGMLTCCTKSSSIDKILFAITGGKYNVLCTTTMKLFSQINSFIH